MADTNERPQTPPPVVDLNSPPTGQRWQIALEDEEHNWDRAVRLGKEVAAALVAVGIALMILYYAWETLHSKEASADAQRWAFGVLSALLSGTVTSLFKR